MCDPSAAALELALLNNGRSVFRVGVADFDIAFNSGCFDMDQVESIWVVSGSYPIDYRVSQAEAQNSVNRRFTPIIADNFFHRLLKNPIHSASGCPLTQSRKSKISR